jgi:hypothetical protein
MQEQKNWEQFCEIPEWIDNCATSEHLSPRVIMEDLEKMRG